MACIFYVNCYTCIINLFCMTDCISLRRGTSKLLELVPNPFDLFNKLCSKQNVCLYKITTASVLMNKWILQCIIIQLLAMSDSIIQVIGNMLIQLMTCFLLVQLHTLVLITEVLTTDMQYPFRCSAAWTQCWLFSVWLIK